MQSLYREVIFRQKSHDLVVLIWCTWINQYRLQESCCLFIWKVWYQGDRANFIYLYRVEI